MELKMTDKADEMKTRAGTFVLVVVFAAVFVNSIVLAREPAEIYISYLGIALLLPLWFLRFGIPSSILYIFGLLLLAGVLNILLGNNTTANFLKIFLGTFMSYLFFYYVVHVFKLRIADLFGWYMKASVVISAIGAIQFISYMAGFKPGYDFSWILNKGGFVSGGNFGIRVNSLFSEPTYLASTLAPAMFVSMVNIIRRTTHFIGRLGSFLVVIVYMLSFSGLAFAGILVAVLLLLVNFGLVRYIILFIPVFFVMFSFLYNNVEDFRKRYDSTVEIFTTGRFEVGETHGSSVILYNNYHVAMENFKTNFLFGTGLGSHQVAFEKYSLTKGIQTWGFDLNSQDANSMLLRLISETGLLGTGLFLLLLFRYFIKRNEEDSSIPDKYWIISNAIFIMIVLNLVRQGHYFINGFPLFIWLYYYNHVQHREFLESAARLKQAGENEVQSVSDGQAV